MSSQERNLITKENGSHVCSAKTESISSLQFDKRIKFRSYSSQFTLGNEILVAIDRREEQKPIENIIKVEVDLSNGICNDPESLNQSRYSNIIKLEEMCSKNPWVKKMITYDTFVDKDVLKSIRDEAMEPNKLYILKHQHKHETTENIAGNYQTNGSQAKKLRTTAAQFNPSNYNKLNKIDSSPISDNSLNVVLQSKTILRNELIVNRGNFQYSIPDDNEQYSSSLSIDLTTHELPLNTEKEQLHTSVLLKDIVAKDHFEAINIEIMSPIDQVDNIEAIEPQFEKKENLIKEVDEIPFAEETDLSDYDNIGNKRNEISKSLQYFLPVFDTCHTDSVDKENVQVEQLSESTRDTVTTDESGDITDKPDGSLKEDWESLDANDFNESFDDNEKQLIDDLIKKEDNALILPIKFCDDLIYTYDIISQENLVMHIHQNKYDSFIFERFDSSPKPAYLEDSIDPFSQFDVVKLEPDVYSLPSFEMNDPITQSDNELKTKMNSSQVKNFIELDKTPHESQSSIITNSYDYNTFTKTRSFSLKRRSEKPEEIVLNDEKLSKNSYNDRKENFLKGNTTIKVNDDDKHVKNLYNDRKEKFLNSDPNLTIQFFKPVSDDIKSPVNTRSISPSTDEEMESDQKNSLSNCSDSSMIIKDVSSDDAYVFPKRPQKICESVMEEEDNTENMEYDLSESLKVTTEDIPHKETDKSSSEELSYYSQTTTSKIDEIILLDLIKTPINSTPGHYEKFLQQRQMRLSFEKSETKSVPLIREQTPMNLDYENKFSFEQLSNDPQNEDTCESNYTMDTSSSSKEFSGKHSNPILRQGESIEDIEEFLAFKDQKNLLYNNNVSGQRFSTSSEDNMSLKNSQSSQNNQINKNKLNITPKNSIENISNKKLPSDILSESESEYSNSSLPNDHEIPFNEEGNVYTPHLVINQKLRPSSDKPEDSHSVSSNTSNHSITISTSTNNSHSPNETVQRASKFIDRTETNISMPFNNNEKRLPLNKNVSPDSSESSTSISTSEDESKSVNEEIPDKQKFIERYETKNYNQKTSGKINKPNLNDRQRFPSTSGSSRSVSTSSEEINAKNESNKTKTLSIDNSASNINIILPKIILPEIKISGSNLSIDSDSSQSLSTSSDELSIHDVIQPKIMDKQEKFIKHKQISLPMMGKQVARVSNSSDSSRTPSTSSAEIPPIKELRKPAPVFIERNEKFKNEKTFSKQTSLPDSKKNLKEKITDTPVNTEKSKSILEKHSSNASNKANSTEAISKPKKRRSFKIGISLPKFMSKLKFKSQSSLKLDKRQNSLSDPKDNLQKSKSIESFPAPLKEKSDYINIRNIPPKSIDRNEQLLSTRKAASMFIEPKSKVPKYSDSSTTESTSSDDNHYVNDITISKKPSVNNNIEKPIKSINTTKEKNEFNIYSKIESFKPSISVPKNRKNQPEDSTIPMMYSVDRREKFTELDKTNMHTKFPRSNSAPNYIEDSSSFSLSTSDDENNILLRKKPKMKSAQSSKTINEVEQENKLKSYRKADSYELLSVVLKDDNLSVDREEKVLMDKDFKEIDIKKDETTEDSSSDYITSTSDDEEPNDILQSSYQPLENNENTIDDIETKYNRKSDHDEAFLRTNKDFRNVLKDVKHDSYESEMTSDEEIDTKYKENKSCSSHDEKPNLDLTKAEKNALIEQNKFNDLYKLNCQVLENTDEENSISISSSDSLSTSSEDPNEEYILENNIAFENQPNMPLPEIERLETFCDPNKSKNIINKPRGKQNKHEECHSSNTSSYSKPNSESSSNKNKKLSKTIDHREKFDDPLNDNHRFAKDKTKDQMNKKTKSIDRREKFAFRDLENNLYKNCSKNELNKEIEKQNSSAVSKSTSTEHSGQNPIVDPMKVRSDSTDDDVTLSLTSLTKENFEQSHQLNECAEKEIAKYSSNSSFENNKNKQKYEKNVKTINRSCQTLPMSRVTKSIPIREKSKSLEKPLTHIEFIPIIRSMPGSLSNIVERRYHESTETWSRQSPIGSDKLIPPFSQPRIDMDHISKVKNTDTFMKNKFNGPLTTKPRPFPSYLSPVNAFPYVPSDHEFGSNDSMVNDYSVDNNVEEIQTRYKSLPEFVKSLSNTSLPLKPIANKKPLKKSIPKRNSQNDEINLNYGELEKKKPISRQPPKKKISVTSVTSDSSYLEKPILRGNNFASSDSFSSLTNFSSIQQPKKNISSTKLNAKYVPNNKKLNHQDVSSMSTSTDSDTHVELHSKKDQVNKLQINKYPSQLSKPVNKENYIRKANSLPQKVVQSSSESSEISSTSDEESSKIYHF